MGLEDFEIGMEVRLAKYAGIVVDKNDESVVVQFNDWASINPWTNSYPRITFKHFALLDKVNND